MRGFRRISSRSLASTFTALLAVTTTACGSHAIVSSGALPVQRVIVYRNGVAYFERAGHVDESEVRFKMKQTEIGDFLATLAVMEQGGSSVRSAAFPLKSNEEPAPLAEGEKPKPLTPDEKAGLETVVLALDGKAHDLQVGYVTESPVWRPSYRLVVGKSGHADLQAWGIVENLSGEDWREVKLSLIGGAPLAFRADLGTPIIPDRPTVTDRGEVIAAVPRGETSLAQGAPPAEASDSERGNMFGDAIGDSFGAGGLGLSGVGEGGGGPAAGVGLGNIGGLHAERKSAATKAAAAHAAPKPMAAAPMAPPAPRQAPAAAISAPRSLQSLAAVAIEGGATRYDLPNAVTVPDKSATMVLLLSSTVPGEAMFLFAPDNGVPDSSSHPFRVARFTNAGKGALDRGPIAVFEEGAFLGQGMIDPLPAGATATVPFALERSLVVDHDRKQDEQGARIAKIDSGELTIETDRLILTKYRIRNGGDTAAKLLVKHGRAYGTTLHDPPAGTDDGIGTGTALVPASVAARGNTELVVDERSTERRVVSWTSPQATTVVKAFLADPKSDGEVVRKLGAAWVIHEEMATKRAQHDKHQNESRELSRSTEETRKNLLAIEKNKTAGALREKLTKRLADTSARLDTLNKEIVELDSALAELGVRWTEALRDLHFAQPVTSTPH